MYACHDAWLAHYGPNPNPGTACLLPAEGTSKLLPRRPSFSPSFRMEPVIVISGDHDDDDETRLAALDEPTVDVKIDSWIYNALHLKGVFAWNPEFQGPAGAR